MHVKKLEIWFRDWWSLSCYSTCPAYWSRHSTGNRVWLRECGRYLREREWERDGEKELLSIGGFTIDLTSLVPWSHALDASLHIARPILKALRDARTDFGGQNIHMFLLAHLNLLLKLLYNYNVVINRNLRFRRNGCILQH